MKLSVKSHSMHRHGGLPTHRHLCAPSLLQRKPLLRSCRMKELSSMSHVWVESRQKKERCVDFELDNVVNTKSLGHSFKRASFTAKPRKFEKVASAGRLSDYPSRQV
jgi:hypothetical protein